MTPIASRSLPARRCWSARGALVGFALAGGRRRPRLSGVGVDARPPAHGGAEPRRCASRTAPTAASPCATRATARLVDVLSPGTQRLRARRRCAASRASASAQGVGAGAAVPPDALGRRPPHAGRPGDRPAASISRPSARPTPRPSPGC